MELISQFVRDLVQQVLPVEIASLVMTNEWTIWAVMALVVLAAAGTAVSALQGGD